MTPEHTTPESSRAKVRRIVTRRGQVVHVHASLGGGVVYVPVVRAWAEAALTHALARLSQAEGGRG
jgi:hypothetical protein